MPSSNPLRSSPSKSQKKTKKRILFVDDEEMARRLFARQMQQHGYVVDLASDSSEALNKAAETQYEALVTDLHMPGKNGVELARLAQRLYPHLAVILVTAERNVELPEDPWTDRALVSVILKPWSTSELLSGLERAVQSTAKRRGELQPPRTLERILLVEDSPADADYFRRLAADTELGFEVRHEARLSAGQEALAEGGWDAVVTDLTLPDARGLDSVQRLRETNAAVPLVVLSGGAEQGEEAIRWGAHDYLNKNDLSVSLLARSLRHAVQRCQQEERLQRQAYEDPLTGIGNRSFFRSRFLHAIARAGRCNDQLGLLFFDLDGFKGINDRLGHHAGDSVLVEVAQRLTQTVREEDTVARLGGDEFAVLLEDIESHEEARIVAERLRTALEKPHSVAGESVVVPPSIGLSLFPDHGENEDELLRLADNAMYRAKKSGCGVAVHGDEGRDFDDSPVPSADNPDAASASVTPIGIVDSVPELKVFFQPQLDIASATFSTVEALLRPAADPTRCPQKLISELEQSGRIHDIGLRTLKQACRRLSSWRRDGWNDLRVAVNVSALQLESDRFTQEVKRVIEAQHIDPASLELEITEACAAHDLEASVKRLQELCDLGIQVALDDFGSGFSGLGQLHHLPIDVLKVDRSFIGELESSGQARRITRHVLDLGRSLDLCLVAEGVETEKQFEFLRENGCHRSQGYLHSRALPPEEIPDFLETSQPAARAVH